MHAGHLCGEAAPYLPGAWVRVKGSRLMRASAASRHAGPSRRTMVTLLVCAGKGSDPSPALGPNEVIERIIGVDAGGDLARSAGYDVDLVVGDLDSISDGWPADRAHRIESQMESDLSKALSLSADRGWNDIVIVGVEGGRSDHALAAWGALAEAPIDLHIRMVVGGDVAHRATPIQPINLELHAGTTFSLFALQSPPDSSTTKVSLEGCKWPLVEENLSFSTRGLSNVALGGLISLTVDGIAVLVVPAP